MAAAAVTLTRQFADQLAGVAEQLIEKVPETDEWEGIRHMLRDTVGLLKKGDATSGVRAFHRVLPYVGRVIGHVEKYMKINDTYVITESLGEHFLVDDNVKKALEDCLIEARLKICKLKEDIEDFGARLDELLDGVISGKEDMGIWTTVKLAFQMNRISALIIACEERLRQARSMLDDLDTHVAGKSFLAHLLTYLAFLGSLAFSATGNLPVGAACLATATASRKSAKSLTDYRQRLSQLDQEHKDLQMQLNQWRARFRAEQRNFLLIIGVKYSLLLTILLAASFFLLGKAGNFMFFGIVIIFMVVKSEQTNNLKYYITLFMGVVAMVMELQKYNALMVFNTGSAIFLVCQFLGFLELL